MLNAECRKFWRIVSAFCILHSAFACARREAQKPNVLLITLDTFRADRIGALTPNLGRLGREAVRFENAVTLRGKVAAPLRYPYKPGMRIRDLIPEREALITPDYYTRKNLSVLSGPVAQGRLAYDVRRLADEINWDYAVIERLEHCRERRVASHLPVKPGIGKDLETVFAVFAAFVLNRGEAARAEVITPHP